MIDLKDISFVIPIKIDHQDRLDNLTTIISFFDKYFINHEILIIEQDVIAKCSSFSEKENVIYKFIESGELMHRTKMLNDGMKMSNRKYVSSYDTDVVFRPEAIENAMDMLRSGEIFVFPYNGVFIDITGTLKTRYHSTQDHDMFPRYDSSVALYTKGVDYHVIHNRGLGGAVFFEKETFLKFGGYNKNFISWGYEDNELVSRFSKLGFNVKRVGYDFCLYHLNHNRGVDSSPNHMKVVDNQKEFNKVNNMDIDTLRKYIERELL